MQSLCGSSPFTKKNGEKLPPRRSMRSCYSVYYFFASAGGGIKPSCIIILASSM